MVADFKLSSPNLRVMRGSLDAPEILEVQTLNPDLIAYDRTRLRQSPHWPPAQDNPWQWLTFLAWHASRRQGLIPGDLTYESWEASTLQVENVEDEDDEEAGVADPTPPGVDPG